MWQRSKGVGVGHVEHLQVPSRTCTTEEKAPLLQVLDIVVIMMYHVTGETRLPINSRYDVPTAAAAVQVLVVGLVPQFVGTRYELPVPCWCMISNMRRSLSSRCTRYILRVPAHRTGFARAYSCTLVPSTSAATAVACTFCATIIIPVQLQVHVLTAPILWGEMVKPRYSPALCSQTGGLRRENTSAGGAPAVEKICAEKRFTRVSQIFIAQYSYKYLCYNNIYFMTPYRKMHYFIIEPRDSSINCCCIATVRGHGTDCNKSGAEDYFRRKTNKKHKIVHTKSYLVYLKQKQKGEISARTSQDTC